MTEPPVAAMQSLQRSLRRLLTWYLSPASEEVARTQPHTVELIATHLASGYRVLSLPVESESEQVVVRTYELPDPAGPDSVYLAPLGDLRADVEGLASPYVTHFLLHGSFATSDYIRGWSDVDTFVVVSTSTVQDPAALGRFREVALGLYSHLLRVDPLQHHGLIVAAEPDLASYPTAFLPPAVFPHAASLIAGRDTFTYRRQPPTGESVRYLEQQARVLVAAAETGVLRHHPYQGEWLRADYENAGNGMYQFKYFLALVMGLPAVFLEAVGRSSYKRDSFEICRGRFAEEWSIVDRASEIRSRWAQHEQHPFSGNCIPEWVRTTVGPGYFEDAARLARRMVVQCQQS